MSTIKKRYTRIASKFIEQIKKEHKIICGLITGSYYNDELTPTSDLDIFIVTDDFDSKRKRGSISINGIKIRYWISPSWKVARLLDEEMNQFKRLIAEMVYYSDCIFGKEKDRQLKKLAKRTIFSKIRKYNRKEKIAFGWKIYELMGTVNKKDYDEPSREYLKFSIFDFCVNVFFAINRVYRPHEKYFLGKIKRIDPVFYRHVSVFLKTKSTDRLILLTNYLLKLLKFKRIDYHIVYDYHNFENLK